MDAKTKISMIIAGAVILFSPSLLQAAEVSGEIVISDDGTNLKAKLKMTLSNSGNTGSGLFQYSDGQNKVRIKVTCLKIDGEYAWFAGQCVENGIEKMGRWFFAVVHDGGKPGRVADHIWWEWIENSDNAESVAKDKVKNMEIPSERKLIKEGDIKVRS